MEQSTDNLTYENLFETLWFAIKYVVTLENPLVTVFVVIFICLNVLHLYKMKTSKVYSDKAPKVYDIKVFGVISVQHPSVKDTLIVFGLAIGLFGLIFYIFFGG